MLKNIIHLFYSTIFANLLNAMSLIVLANFLGAKNYGMFSVSLGVTMIMFFFTDLGISNTFLQEGVKQEENFNILVSSYVKSRIIFLIVNCIICYVGIHIFYNEKEFVNILEGLLFSMLIGLTLQSIGVTYFQLIEEMKYIAAIKIFAAVFLMIITIVCAYFQFKPYVTVFLYGLAYIIGGINSLYLVCRKIKLQLNGAWQKQLFHQLVPFLMSGLLIMIIPQLGPIILKHTLSFTLIGIFMVAYRIPAALYQMPGVIAGAFFPVLFRNFSQNDIEKHTKLNILQMKCMTIVGMGTTIFIYYFAPYFISILFDSEWDQAVLPLKILAFLIVLQSINIAIADGLTTKGQQMRRTMIQFLVLIVGGIAFYILSLAYGINGAAYAAILLEIVALVGYIAVNEIRMKIIKEVIIPYMCYFCFPFVVIQYILGTYVVIAMILNVILIVVLIFTLDRDMKKLIIDGIEKIRKRNSLIRQGT
ncbi:oligosaccharide flippase family protein [Bacillus sp. WLY-B-L8]|uniref:oligosaccharide flippase family protein n=1 Tax=Bacillus multifaciens TaxID=3068506 RepID=UPI002740D6CB|nr:oligosaccharide flippase family protein [Bacillus sp. WLY-B-L8]MDP7977896.1 oligosaccharide flippase family protein [Bacillus sp. WLY-B-L8]